MPNNKLYGSLVDILSGAAAGVSAGSKSDVGEVGAAEAALAGFNQGKQNVAWRSALEEEQARREKENQLKDYLKELRTLRSGVIPTAGVQAPGIPEIPSAGQRTERDIARDIIGVVAPDKLHELGKLDEKKPKTIQQVVAEAIQNKTMTVKNLFIISSFLGMLILWLLAIVVETGMRRILPSYHPPFPWAGIFTALEWHMLWAAMSGMETILHALIVTSVLAALATGSRRYLMLGLLTGLSVWMRPDGLTLLGPVGVTIIMVEQDQRSRIRAFEQILIGFVSLFLLYLLFNLLVGGRPLPNTYFAKQAEHALWQARPVTEKAGQLAIQLLVGPVLVLLPGI